MLGFDVVRSRLATAHERLVDLVDGIDDHGWNRRTRCPGWRVRDAAWHIAWGAGPGEVIEAARLNLDPPEYATARMGPAPADVQEIVAAARHKAGCTRKDVDALADDDAGMVVRYGRGDSGGPLSEFLWGRLVEAIVHTDDIATALGIDQSVDADFAEELVRRRTRAAVAIASADGLQPAQPRGYRYRSRDADCGFYFADAAWHEGTADVPSCVFESDPTTLMRLVMGRIPIAPYDATWGRPWDDRLKLSGDLHIAPAEDAKRWCYGTW